MSRVLLAAVCAAALVLAACGGGGSSSSGQPSAGSGTTGVTGVDTPATVSVVTATDR